MLLKVLWIVFCHNLFLNFRFNELWVAGGPAANALKPKFGVFASREQSHAGIQVPEIEVRISAIEKFERDCRLIRKIKPKLWEVDTYLELWCVVIAFFPLFL